MIRILMPAILAAALSTAPAAWAQTSRPAVPNPLQPGGAPAPVAAPGAPRATPSPSRGGDARFPTEAAAQAHCPGDAVVWVNARSGAVHARGTKFYGHTKAGAYACQRDADAGRTQAGAAAKPTVH